MKTLLQRLLPSLFHPAPEATVPAERRRSPATPVPQEPATQAEGGASALGALESLAIVGARRPLIASGGDVAGFEFRIREDVGLRLRRRTEQRALAAHASALLNSARLIAQTGRVGLARVPVGWLAQVAPLDLGERTMVAIEEPRLPDEDAAGAQALQALVERFRRSGARVGWGSNLQLPLKPDFQLLSQGSQHMVDLLRSAHQAPAEFQGLPLVVTDVASVEDLEQALAAGASHVCGALTAQVVTTERRDKLPVPPEVQRISQLLNQLATGAETDTVVGQIKGDVGLSYRLLRRMNSAGFAQLSKVNTIDQAVLLLGRNELYRWLCMMLVQYTGTRKVSSALQEITLWRSRLMELLAMACDEPSPGQLFTLGLASMLGLLLKLGMDDVIAALNLTEPAQQALLHQAGPWQPYLDVAEQVEAQTLYRCPDLAERFGGVHAVAALSDQAWDWAHAHSAQTAVA